MPWALKDDQQSGQTHSVTFTRPRRPIFGILILAMTVAAQGQGKNQSTLASHSPADLKDASACERIEGLGTDFRPLAEVCHFALSQNTLPNIICSLNEKQFATLNSADDWQLSGEMTAEITVHKGLGDQYTNVAINSKPIKGLKKPHTVSEVIRYFKSHGVPVDVGSFGMDLLTIFNYPKITSFTYKGEMRAVGKNFAVFSFEIRKAHQKDDWLNLSIGASGVETGLSGLLWIDENTSRIRRTVAHNTEIDPDFPIDVFSTATDYDSVEISPLGPFLMPVRGQVLACLRDRSRCWRTEITYSNCRRFGAQSRILPQEPAKP